MKNIPVRLDTGLAKNHADANRQYMLRLDPERLLANYYIQAGLNSNIHQCPKHYGGWENPDQQVRGNIVGHYMSACAMRAYYDEDREMQGRVERMVNALEKCQQENEDGWCGSIPPVYLDRIARKKWVWAPMYNVHKSLMGLTDTYLYTGYDKAEEIIDRWADWMLRWINDFDDAKMQDILDWETGGMMEVWASLFARTHKEKYRILMERFAHIRFFAPLNEEKDILTNTHANTTIPEAHGFAAAYLATGDDAYRAYAENYLECALNRDTFCTGGQTSGEGWLKKLTYSDLGIQTQEHCSVYNMIRLCEYVMQWNPDVRYAEYIEKNIKNGLMTQHRLSDGMNTYYLPLGAGVRKDWSTPEDHMTCCLGTTLQANSSYEARVLFEDENGLVVSQAIPCHTTWKWQGKEVKIQLLLSDGGDNTLRPEKQIQTVQITCETKTFFHVKVRVPGWSEGTSILVNGTEYARFDGGNSCWVDIPGEWSRDEISVVCTRALQLSKLGDEDYYAMTYGGVVLAGLTDEPEALPHLNCGCVSESIRPRAVRDWVSSTTTWYSVGQPHTTIFKPLQEIDEEQYTVYFAGNKHGNDE